MIKFQLLLPFEAETILNIPLSYDLPEEKLIWVGNIKGEFIVKNVVESHSEGESSSGDPISPPWGEMWHLKISPKSVYLLGEPAIMLFQ